MVGEYLDFSSSMTVADLGSMDVNGCHRELIPPSCNYVGVDIVPGKNVDVVMPSEYSIPLDTNHFDALISGQCFEHVRNPFKLMAEVERVVKPGGWVLVTAPFVFFEHRYPLDCWRFLCDGWRAVFDECGLELVKTEYVRPDKSETHCWAAGRVRRGDDE
jgi:SAM-dependent methyltransferase